MKRTTKKPGSRRAPLRRERAQPAQHPKQRPKKQDPSDLGPKPSPRMRNEKDQIVPSAPGMRHAIFPLLEGDVTLSFPVAMSPASAKALALYIKLFLEQSQSQAEERERWQEAQKRWREEHGREVDE